ncbi:MAG: hypothetical protein KDA17_00990 [Candidatus Saccharibacteria bacterium]|nr:hypothetical protein [Candidatus Saccharibacteria bacterium]
MRVRKGYAPQVGNSFIPQIYLRNNAATPEAFGAAIGRGLQSLAAGVGKYAQKVEAQERAATSSAFSRWSFDVEQTLVDERAKSDANDANYFDRASSIIENKRREFLQTVKPRYLSDFEPRVTQTAIQYAGAELEYDLQKKDNWFSTEFKSVADVQRLRVRNDPNLLDNARASLIEQLEASDLPETRKAALLRDGMRQIEASAYEQNYLGELSRGAEFVIKGYKGAVVSSVDGSALPQNFRALDPQVQQRTIELSSMFGKPLRITPHGGKQPDSRKSTSQHHSGKATDVLVADYNDDDKKRLIALAIMNGAQGVGGYGAGDGKGTLHFDYREGKGNGPDGLALWWRHKPGQDGSYDSGPAWFREGVELGIAMRNGEVEPNKYQQTSLTDRIIGVESGGRADSKSSTSSASGYGQFINSTWRSFIAARHPELLNADYLKYRADKTLAREGIEWYLGKIASGYNKQGLPVNDASLYLGYFLGPADAAKVLKANPAAPVSDFVSRDSVNANKSVLAGKTVGDVLRWAANKMGQQTIMSSIDDDPRYANLDYDSRLTIRNDVETFVRQQQAAAKKAKDAAEDEQRNNLYVGLLHGDFDNPRGQVAAAEKAGLLTDYDDIKKAMTIIEDREKDLEDQYGFTAKLADGAATWVQSDKDDRKRMNAFAKTISQNINDLDGNVLLGLTRVAERTNMLPPDTMAQLMAMSRQSDWRRAKYAFETLAELQEFAPEAVNASFTKDELDRLALYREHRGLLPEDKLSEFMSATANPNETNTRRALREEAEQVLKDNSLETPRQIYEAVMNEVDNWIPFNQPSIINFSKQVAIADDFRAAYTYYYTLGQGNKEFADKMAIDTIKQTWGPTKVDGRDGFMKFPPEKFYETFEGSYDYITQQIRKDYKLDPSAEIELVSDSTTEKEVNLWKSQKLLDSEGNPRGPSYAVFVRREDGMIDVLDDPGIYFEYTPEMRQRNRELIEAQIARETLLQRDYANVLRDRDAVMRGVQPPPEYMTKDEKELKKLLDEEEAAQQEEQRRIDEFIKNNAPKGVHSNFDAAGRWKDYNPDKAVLERPSMWKASVPTNIRTFLATLFGSKEDVTEQDFTAKELSTLRTRIENKIAKTGQKSGVIGYGEYSSDGATSKYYSEDGSTSLFDIVIGSFSDVETRLETTLGVAKYEKLSNGDIVITDEYDFAATPEQVAKAKQANGGALGTVVSGLKYSGVTGALNAAGNLMAPKGQGRKVRIVIKGDK